MRRPPGAFFYAFILKHCHNLKLMKVTQEFLEGYAHALSEIHKAISKLEIDEAQTLDFKKGEWIMRFRAMELIDTQMKIFSQVGETMQ